MHQLLLLRHAKSSWDDSKLADRDRPLNERGRRAAATMRGAMHRLGLAPDVVLVSPARRAVQTLDALEPWDDTPLIEHVEALYLATPPQILAVLRDTPETVRSVLLIGHNPGMHDLAQALMTSMPPTDMSRRLISAYPTAALAEFTIPGPWLRVAPGAGRLIRFLTPRELERSS
ncbi:MAG TPA: histidine phosphatase family protein [Acetobacteraceae bacterium]|jgi:phosphohistidine phosphatase|nr:histidine phosphatase family protein [Acetobacteraceae bacterium]